MKINVYSPPPRQEKSMWCWAAVADYVADTLSVAKGQCNIAQLCLPSLCKRGCSHSACNQGFYLDVSLSQAGHPANWTPNPCSDIDIIQQINQGLPVGIRIEWGGGKGHFVAIFGYFLADNAELILDVYDPNPGIFASVPSSTLRQAYGGIGIWSDTYFLV